MNRFIVVLFGLFVLISSCSKQKKTEKRISGTWNVVEYRYTETSSLSYYPEVSGTIFFENCASGSCTYSISMSYNSPQLTGSRVESGRYEIFDKGASMNLFENGSGGEIPHLNYEILFISRTDAIIRYVEGSAVHQLTLEK